MPTTSSGAFGHHLPLVTDLDAWERTIGALARSEVSVLFDLVSEGTVLPLPPDTDLAIEDDFATLLRVRVLAREWNGRTGWLPSAAVPHLRLAPAA